MTGPVTTTAPPTRVHSRVARREARHQARHDARHEARHDGAGPRRRPARRPAFAIVGVTLLVAAAITGVVVLRSNTPALAAGAWSAQFVAGPSGVRDASGTWWAPAGGGLRGGTATPTDAAALTALTGTGSPQLYGVARQGARSWTVRLPRASRYAIDLLVAPPATGAAAGQNVFDVTAELGRGRTATLRRGVDPAAWTAGQPQHVTGMVTTGGTSLTLRLTARRGVTAVTGLTVTSAPSRKPRTILDDTFGGPAGAAPPAHWRHRTGSGPFGATELQGYTDDRAHSRLDGRGNLEIVATRDRYTDRYGSRAYTSARLDTRGTVSVAYGRIEATLQAPPGRGMWAAVWAVGTNEPAVGWPRSGEIDVTEVLGSHPRNVAGHLHGLGDERDATGDTRQPVSNIGVEVPAPIDLTTTRHTSAVFIQPGAVTFSLNGQPYFVATREDLRPGQQWPIGHPYYLIVNLAIGGWHGPPDGATPFPGRLLVDRIRVQGWS